MLLRTTFLFELPDDGFKCEDYFVQDAHVLGGIFSVLLLHRAVAKFVILPPMTFTSKISFVFGMDDACRFSVIVDRMVVMKMVTVQMGKRKREMKTRVRSRRKRRDLNHWPPTTMGTKRVKI